MYSLAYASLSGKKKSFTKIYFVMFTQSNVSCEVCVQLQNDIFIFLVELKIGTEDDLAMKLHEPGKVVIVKVGLSNLLLDRLVLLEDGDWNL